jgi:hypothetical protein
MELKGFNRWLLENPVPQESKNLKNIFYSTAPTEDDYKLADLLDQDPIKGTDTYVVAVQWRAEGILKDMAIDSTVSLGILGIPAMIRKAKSIHCAYVTEKDNTQCDPKYPVFAFMNINDLGEPMENVIASTKLVGAETWRPSKAFCSVLWN